MHRGKEFPKAFQALGLEPPILRACAKMAFEEPSPVQRELTPHILAGRDVIGQARTGTGKTAAFSMASLQMIDVDRGLQMLVLTPTRELASQVLGEIRRLAEFTQIRSVPVYGGTRMKQTFHDLGRKPHVVVGTPGRIMDMMRRGSLKLDELRFAILDEVDRMLDIGFRDDIRQILGVLKHPHQTIFVSATIEDEINRLSRQYMKDPVEVNVSRDQITVGEIDQFYCAVLHEQKFDLLKHLLDVEQPKLAIVFCNTKHSVRKLAKRLHAFGINAREIHGDLIQEKREKVMERFRSQRISVLVATDLAARGIDVRDISHIINYDLPQEIQIYVHRIGRTARMGKTGKAITLVTPEEGASLFEVEKLINKEITQLVVDGFDPNPVPAPPRTTRTKQHATAAEPPAETVPAGEPSPNLLGRYPSRRRGRRFR